MANDTEMRHPREYTVEELCETVFYLSRYAECMEIDKTITVPDERELLWMIRDWAVEFEQNFDPDRDHQTELETKGPQWLLENFPYMPELDEQLVPEDGPAASCGMTEQIL